MPTLPTVQVPFITMPVWTGSIYLGNRKSPTQLLNALSNLQDMDGILVVEAVLTTAEVVTNGWNETMGHGKKAAFLKAVNDDAHLPDGPLRE